MKKLLLPLLCVLFSGCAIAQTTPFNNISVAGTSAFTGIATFNNQIHVNSDVYATGLGNFGGNLTVIGFVSSSTGTSTFSGGLFNAPLLATSSFTVNGAATFNGTVQMVEGAVFNQTAIFEGHLAALAPVPTVTAGGIGSCLGTTGTCTLDSHSSDTAGSISFTPGGTISGAPGQLLHVTFGSSYSPTSTKVYVTLGAGTSGAAALQIYVPTGTLSATGFDLYCGVTPASGTTYSVSYVVIGSQ